MENFKNIFANHIKSGYSDHKLLMDLRGDSNIKSSEVYLDYETVK